MFLTARSINQIRMIEIERWRRSRRKVYLPEIISDWYVSIYQTEKHCRLQGEYLRRQCSRRSNGTWVYCTFGTTYFHTGLCTRARTTASCRREAATICTCPGLQVVTRSHTHMDRSLTRRPCWPASTANQSGLVTFTFWPWKWCPSHVWLGLPLCQL